MSVQIERSKVICIGSDTVTIECSFCFSATKLKATPFSARYNTAKCEGCKEEGRATIISRETCERQWKDQ